MTIKSTEILGTVYCRGRAVAAPLPMARQGDHLAFEVVSDDDAVAVIVAATELQRAVTEAKTAYHSQRKRLLRKRQPMGVSITCDRGPLRVTASGDQIALGFPLSMSVVRRVAGAQVGQSFIPSTYWLDEDDLISALAFCEDQPIAA